MSAKKQPKGAADSAVVINFPSPIESAALPWAEKGSAALLQAHAEYLIARGIKRASFKAAGYRSEPDGLVIPYPDVEGGFLDFGRKRLLPTRVYNGKEMKFIQPSKPPRFYFWSSPKLTEWRRDPTRELFLAEGETRGAAIGQHGHFVIALGGAWNWLHRTEDDDSTPIDDFDKIEWKGRTVVLVYDADTAKKYYLQLAILRLARTIEGRGGIVRMVIVPDLGDGKTGADDYIAAKGIKEFMALRRRSLDEPEFESWGIRSEARLTETGNAERLALLYGERLRYIHQWKRWLEWDGSRWKADETEHVTQIAIRSARSMLREAAALMDSAQRDPLMKWAVKSESASNIDATLRIARSTPPLPVTARDLDAHPLLLGVRNGVVDLETGELLSARPEWLITKQAPVEFDPAARAPTFERFLDETMCGRADLAAYIQRCVGYFLTGDTREQCFWIWHGTGANGKSTLFNALLAFFGDEYSRKSRMETWAEQRRTAGGPSEDIAGLHGARLVVASETEQNRRLAESLIKELTGQDKVRARFLFKDSFEFVPQFKLVLVCNHKPIVDGNDPALWRRLRLVPFERIVPDAEQDKTLRERLLAELPGILNWAIAGCLEWQRNGLREPRAVLNAAEEYRKDSDIVSQFVAEECEAAANAESLTRVLYSRYRDWVMDRGIKSPMTEMSFSLALQERGYSKARDSKTGRSAFKGLRLKTGQKF